MDFLRISLFVPHAHLKIPYTRNYRFTYSLPPFSTVLGLLANIIGNKNFINEFINNNFSLSILSKHETITQEYTWMRNLAKDWHNQLYGSSNNRKQGEIFKHPGGISPNIIQTLENVEVLIYFKHSKKEIENILKENINKPERWLSHLHLGRSEDWAMVKEIKEVKLKSSSQLEDLRWTNCKDYLTWLPSPENYIHQNSEYKKFYEGYDGIAMLIPTLYKLIPIKKNEEKFTIRNFKKIPVKIFFGSLPYNTPDLYVDVEYMLPIFPAVIKG